MEANKPCESARETADASPHTPEDFVRRIQMALEQGAFPSARYFATLGAAHYPDHLALGQYAKVLAPPTVMRRAVPPTTAVRANRDWLNAHGKDYRGHWVALQHGKLRGVADSLGALVEQVGNTTGVLLTRA